MQISSDKFISLLSQSARSSNVSSVNQTSSSRVEKISRNNDNTLESLADNNTKRPQRFNVDEQAIALIEQELKANSDTNFGGEIVRSNTNSSSQSESFQRQQPNDLERIRDLNQSALSTYQSINSLSNRENIQQLFGVDLFA